MEEEYFQCACNSPEHTLHFKIFNDEPKMLCAYVFLNTESWYKRILIGFKYIFGYKCKYGHFDEFILKNKDIDKFIEMLNEMKQTGE